MRMFYKFLIFSVLSILARASYKNEELLLVVEVSRHGARSSKKIYDFTKDSDLNFKNSS
jgi:hypothetical protein